MKLIDISRELTTAPVYPGDPAPQLTRLQQISLGDMCNLTALSLCAHNGTHLDAPRHFLLDGGTVEQLPLSACCGECSVVEAEGVLLGDEAERLLARGLAPRILFKGKLELDVSAAFVLSDAGLTLVGVEAPSVAAPDQTEAVHRQLLGRGTLVLEGLDLSAVPPGRYFLFAAPLKIAGCEGAPVRAILVDREAIDVDEAFRRR